MTRIKQTTQLHPLYWILTFIAAILFHTTAHATPEHLNRLYSSLESLDSHGLNGAYYQSQMKDRVKTYNITDISDDNLKPFIQNLVADLRFGFTRNKPLNPESAEFAEVNRLVGELNYCQKLPVCFQAIAARDAAYVPLQKHLAEYKTIERKGGWPKVAEGATLKPGMNDARVAQVKQLLLMNGDYHADDAMSSINNNLYDEHLVAAVERFQKRHGLEVDGAIGPATRKAMNVPVEDRIEQIAMSLERLRQLPQASGHHIRVNIPSYRLHAYENDKEVLGMDVIVGKKDRPTPLFDNHINTLVMNPTWTPTANIMRKDILPKVRNNPSYLVNGNYQVTDAATGQSLDPYSVDWNSVSVGDVRIVQRSGSKNALGKIKFLLPQNDSVYLHDTSSPRLFSKSYRALSSGCIRLSQPEALLEYVASAQSDPSFTKADSYYKSNTRRTMKVDNPIHVKVTYFTAWVNAEGQMEFYDDIYSKDSRLQLALSKQQPQYASN